MMERIAFFTAGSIGAGHLAHALAIERGLRRAGYGGDYHIFSPGVPGFIEAPDHLTVVPMDMATLKEPARAKFSQLATELRGYDPDLLIIDMFWVPILHIMDDLRARRWLLIRKCPPAWLVGPSFARFDPGRYDRVLAIEPMEHRLLGERIEPIVLCNRDEMKPAGALRRRLGVGDEEHLSVVMQAGLEGEVDAFAPAEKGHIFRSDPHAQQEMIFPMAPWLADVDALFCGAGYNSFWEAKWLGYFERTHFRAFERPIDDQAWRLRECAGYEMAENGADQLAQMVLEARR